MIRAPHTTRVSMMITLALLGLSLAPSAAVERAVVTVTLTPHNPPNTIPAAGGQFAYSVEVGNDETTALEFDVWTTIDLPGGGSAEGYGPVELRLPGGWSAREDLAQLIPSSMPDGPYTYTANAGIYPDVSWGSDSFEFEKLPGTTGWYTQSPGADNALSGVSFVDENTGWSVSRYREILHTTDGGDVWVHLDDGQYYPHQYNDVHFVDTQTGWVVGHGWSLGGTILHTTDAGTTWIEQDPYYDYELNKVFFIDAGLGWAVGGEVDIYGSNHRQVIEHTTDGGDTWQGQWWESYEYPFASVHFADASHGWAVGGPGYILHTTNGGGQWSQQSPPTNSYLNDVCFIDAVTGWCVGDDGTVLHTTDGGGSWLPQSTGTSAAFKTVCFVDAMTGWIAGVDYGPMLPAMFFTSDGGVTWQGQDTGTGSDFIVIRDLSFAGADHGWASGSNWPDVGVMLHTENGGGSTTGIDEPGRWTAASVRARVSEPYPNPFNPRTRIRFSIPGETSRHVTVAIFDLGGRRIRSLTDAAQEPGEHVVEWDGLTDHRRRAASGVYLYSVTIGDFATTGKLTLLK